MMKEVLKAMSGAALGLWRNRRVASVLAALYASLLAVLYLFIATREATALQVLLTLCFAALAPALFFILQAMIMDYAQGEAQALRLLRRSLRESCKLALVSLPLVLLAVILTYLLNRLQPYSYSIFRITTPAWPMQLIWPSSSGRWIAGAGQMRQWSLLMMATLRFLLFGILLPLLAIHLWSATVRDGLLPVLRRAPRTLAAAFTPPSVLIYTLGLTLFAIIPYFLLFGHTHAGRARVEIGLFIARLLLIFLFTLFGWTITVSALNQRTGDE